MTTTTQAWTQMGCIVVPIEREDIGLVVDIAAAAFEHNRHTRMKMVEKGVHDVADMLEPRANLEAAFAQPGVHMLKALDGDRIVGFSNWREWNFGVDVRGAPIQTPSLSDPLPPPDLDPHQTPVQRLEATTTAHTNGMISRLNRPDTRTVFCTGTSVLPEYQGRGVGSALLDAALAIADANDAQSWVHLSDHPGKREFEKKGFEAVNSLTVDLDEYAEEREHGEKWGEYTFRFMLRHPRPSVGG